MSRQRTRPMTVGELSRRTGVPTKTLRAYTDLGLINTLGRSPTGYRLYDTGALWCVQFIGEMRGLGLTIAEIRDLAAAYPNGNGGAPPGQRLAQLLHRSRERLTQRITAQQDMLRRIEQFEAEHRAGLTGGRLCWSGDPRCSTHS